FEQALAAHDEARRLDPNVPTSLEQTLLMTGDIERLLVAARLRVHGGGDQAIQVIGLGLAGRREEARASLVQMQDASRIPAFRTWIDYLMAWLERRPADMIMNMAEISSLKILDDPEAMFQDGWLLCDAGEHERGLAQLQRAVAKGYFVCPTLSNSPQFDALRNTPAFEDVLTAAEAGRQRALTAFRDGGGERLLGR
ncbi:MAG: hypothetical protein ACREBE_02740, partial [bacterium]